MHFNKKIHRGIIVALIVIGAVGLAGLGLNSYGDAFAKTTTPRAKGFSGRATVVQAHILPKNKVPGQNILLADTGLLVTAGGGQEASLSDAEIPGVLTGGVLHAAAIGVRERSDGEASMTELNLTIGGNTISADFIMAQAAAKCEIDVPQTSAGSQVEGLMVNGVAIPVTTAQNQTVNLVGGTMTINERVNGNGQVTVTALHIIINNVADIAIVRASAGVTCPAKKTALAPTVSFIERAYAWGSALDDFVTGAGWITGTPSHAPGVFGVIGGIDNGNLFGHLVYLDLRARVSVQSTAVTGYCAVNATTRRITGTAKVNMRSGFTYTVEVSDQGRPNGRPHGYDNDDDKCSVDSLDTFSIALSNGYTAQGNLRFGNIRLEDDDGAPVPPCTPPVSTPTVTLSANPVVVPPGASSTLSWSTTNATTCTASSTPTTTNWSGSKPLSGPFSVTFGGAGIYALKLLCTGPGGTASSTATVTVVAPAPTVTLGAIPSFVTTPTAFASSFATWSSTNATTCTATTTSTPPRISDWTGARALSGSMPVGFGPLGPGDFIEFILTLTCTGPGGTAAASTTVFVENETPG